MSSGVRYRKMRGFGCLALLTSTVLLGGCWDRKEINDIAFVQATAIDTDKEGFRVSVMIPLPGNMGGATGGGGGSGGGKPYAIDSATGKSPREAFLKLQHRMSRQLFLSHRRVLLVSEKVARMGLTPLLDGSTRTPENRLTSFFAITRQSAYEVLSAPIKLERFSAELIREMLQSPYTPHITFMDVVVQTSAAGDDAPIPIIEHNTSITSKNASSTIGLAGIAITREGKMVGALQGDEEHGFRFLRYTFKPYLEAVDSGGHKASLLVTRGMTRIRPHVNGNRIEFDISVRAEGDILETTDDRDYGKAENLQALENLLQAKIKQNVERTIAALQRDKSDVAGFGSYLYRAYPQRWKSEWERQWYDLLPRCTFRVSVSANVHRIGMQRENLAKKGK